MYIGKLLVKSQYPDRYIAFLCLPLHACKAWETVASFMEFINSESMQDFTLRNGFLECRHMKPEEQTIQLGSEWSLA